MELFGYLCSPLCRAKADSHGLDIPVYEGLGRVCPRLVPGGIALVDDCPPKHSWAGARVGYERFVHEQRLPEEYFMDMGIVHGRALPSRGASPE